MPSRLKGQSRGFVTRRLSWCRGRVRGVSKVFDEVRLGHSERDEKELERKQRSFLQCIQLVQRELDADDSWLFVSQDRLSDRPIERTTCRAQEKRTRETTDQEFLNVSVFHRETTVSHSTVSCPKHHRFQKQHLDVGVIILSRRKTILFHVWVCFPRLSLSRVQLRRFGAVTAPPRLDPTKLPARLCIRKHFILCLFWCFLLLGIVVANSFCISPEIGKAKQLVRLVSCFWSDDLQIVERVTFQVRLTYLASGFFRLFLSGWFVDGKRYCFGKLFERVTRIFYIIIHRTYQTMSDQLAFCYSSHIWLHFFHICCHFQRIKNHVLCTSIGRRTAAVSGLPVADNPYLLEDETIHSGL